MALSDNLISYWKLDGDSTDEVASNDGSDTDVSYTQFEFYNGTPDNQTAASGAAWRAQTFTPSTSHSITSVKIKVYRVDTPGTATVGIYATSGGVPTGSALVSNTFDADTITTDTAGEWVTITLSATALTASTKYAIVVSVADSGADILNWKNDYEGTYTGGSLCTSADSGSSWAANTDYDQVFFEYGTGDSGKINQGAGFNGTTSKILGDAITIPTDATISCWFNSTQTGSYGVLFGFQKSDVINPRFYLQFRDGGVIRGTLVDSDAVAAHVYYDSESTINDGNWHFAVLVKTGSSIELFVDNNSKGTDSDTFTGNFEDCAMVMGIEHDNPYYYEGLVDECAYWSRALSEAEVGQLYASGSGNQYPFSIAYTLTCEVGAFVLTGINISITKTLHFIASTGSFALTGINAIINRGYNIVAQVGQFILTGINAGINLFQSWGYEDKNTTSYTNQTKNTTSFTNQTKNSSSWTYTDKS